MNGIKNGLGNMKAKGFHLWLKIAISCVIAVVIILAVLFINGVFGGKQGMEPDSGESEAVQATEFIEGNNETPQETEAETGADEPKTYDTIIFGEWRGEPIVWRVLEIQDQSVLVISEKILALRQYYDDFPVPPRADNSEDLSTLTWAEYGEIVDAFSFPTWGECSLRSWLNNDFYQAAFSEQEQQAINVALVQTPDFETEYETLYSDDHVEKTPVVVQGFDDTEDMVFCLSVEEAYRYFCSCDDRIASLTVTQQDYDYAVQTVEAINGSIEGWEYVFGGYTMNENSPKMWWLRSGTYVDPYGDIWIGSISGDGELLGGWPCGVRPAMWLQLGVDGVDIM